MKKVIVVVSILFSSLSIQAQYQIGLVPRTSPDKGAFQKIGLTEIDIKYGSPSVKGRTVWGGIVPYDKVWRAGANNATTIEFSTDVIVEGKPLPQGKYAFFIIPQKNDKWIAVFNKEAKQWGAFRYKEDSDALRVEVLPVFNNAYNEELKYSINNYGFQYGTLNLEWERLKIQIEVNTDYSNQFKDLLESRLAAADDNIKWVIYIQGAEHLEEINTNLDLANTWIEAAEKLFSQVDENNWNKQFYPIDYIEGHLYWTKAKLLSRKGDYVNALKYAEKMKMADEKSFFYNREKESEGIDEIIEEWKSME